VSLANIDRALERTRAAKPVERLVLALLARHAHKDDLQAWPGQDLLARRAGVSERYVREAIQTLVELGEVKIIRRGAKGRAMNVYSLTILRDDFELIEVEGNRNPSSGSEPVTTGTPVPVCESGKPEPQFQRNRNPSSSRRMREGRSTSSGAPGGEVEGAEKRVATEPTVFPGNDHIAVCAVAGAPGDHAREAEARNFDNDPDYIAWLAEAKARVGAR
jgi:hypothetical protein